MDRESHEGSPDERNHMDRNTILNHDCVRLYVKTKITPHFLHFQTVDGSVHFVYKKVAMVEQFFDIIYSVHVEAAANQAAQAAQAASEGTTPPSMRGRAGKHCGQKRTYRAVSILFNIRTKLVHQREERELAFRMNFKLSNHTCQFHLLWDRKSFSILGLVNLPGE